MSLPLSRNVVSTVSLVAFALAMFLAPAVNAVFLVFLLAMGLAISTMAHVLWHAPPVAVSLMAPSVGTDRRASHSSR